MANNKELLTTLQQVLSGVHPSLVQKLNPGLSSGEIDAVAKSAQLSFTEEIYDLFTWKNGIQHEGISSTDQLLIFPNGIPYTLQEAANDYDILSVTKHFFETSYFPLFSGSEEAILLLDLDPGSVSYQMISLFSPPLLGDTTPVPIFDSFSRMLETVISCYKQKAFWIDQDCLQVDSDAHYTIASSFNPNSQYWQYM